MKARNMFVLDHKNDTTRRIGTLKQEHQFGETHLDTHPQKVGLILNGDRYYNPHHGSPRAGS